MKNSIATILTFGILMVVFGFTGPVTAQAATDPGLGAAASFSILANTAVTNVPTSVISGNVGLNNAGTNYAGLSSTEVAGTIYDTNGTGPDGAAAILPPAVQADASTANGNISGQASTGSIGPVLDALTLTTGVYDIGAGRLNGGVLHLNGPGVYIFRSSSDLISSGSIDLQNGARACDVYWQVPTLATINGSSFVGTIIASTGIHFGANVTLDGRALAIGGDVTLISDTFTGPTCAAPSGGGGGGGGGSIQSSILIDLTKAPNPTSLPSGGGAVTYTYTVRNFGTVPLSSVTLVDNTCNAVTRVSGDTNNDSILDLTETWTYTCTSVLSATTTNTATASGTANGQTVTDTAVATVPVDASVTPTPVPPPPGLVLPGAGLPPKEKGAPWGIIIPIAIFISFFAINQGRKKLKQS